MKNDLVTLGRPDPRPPICKTCLHAVVREGGPSDAPFLFCDTWWMTVSPDHTCESHGIEELTLPDELILDL